MKPGFTIRNLLVLTALVAIGVALLRYAFGLGIAWLAFIPVVAMLMLWRSDRNRKIQSPMIVLCLIPPHAVSMGLSIAIQRMVWGHVSPDWHLVGYKFYRPFGFVWATPSLQSYGYRFEYIWQEIGFWLGRNMSIHDARSH